MYLTTVETWMRLLTSGRFFWWSIFPVNHQRYTTIMHFFNNRQYAYKKKLLHINFFHSDNSHREWALTSSPLGRAESVPSFCQNNSKNFAHIDTKFGVPYPILIWHRMTKFCRNWSESFWEIYVFVGWLPAKFDQNRLNVNKFAKNRVLKKTAQKDQYRCKITRPTKKN